MPVPPDENLEFQFDRRVTELESRFAFQEQALQEMSDALAAARADGERNANL
jgi:SlyX protein